MTNPQVSNYSDFERYQYAALAARFLGSKENARFASGALETLAGGKGLNLGEEAIGFIRGAQASEKGIQTAIQVYNGKFEEKRGDYTPAQLAGWYSSVLAGLDKKDSDKLLFVLSKYAEPIKKIRLDVQKAAHALETPGGLSPQEEENANKIMEKYGPVAGLMEVLDSYKFESLRGEAVNSTRKQELKNLASQL